MLSDTKLCNNFFLYSAKLNSDVALLLLQQQLHIHVFFARANSREEEKKREEFSSYSRARAINVMNYNEIKNNVISTLAVVVVGGERASKQKKNCVKTISSSAALY